MGNTWLTIGNRNETLSGGVYATPQPFFSEVVKNKTVTARSTLRYF